jgi:hypothetical protein
VTIQGLGRSHVKKGAWSLAAGVGYVHLRNCSWMQIENYLALIDVLISPTPTPTQHSPQPCSDKPGAAVHLVVRANLIFLRAKSHLIVLWTLPRPSRSLLLFLAASPFTRSAATTWHQTQVCAKYHETLKHIG